MTAAWKETHLCARTYSKGEKAPWNNLQVKFFHWELLSNHKEKKMLKVTHLLRAVPETHEAQDKSIRPGLPSTPGTGFCNIWWKLLLVQYIKTLKAVQNCKQLVSKILLHAFTMHAGSQHDMFYSKKPLCSVEHHQPNWKVMLSTLDRLNSGQVCNALTKRFWKKSH